MKPPIKKPQPPASKTFFGKYRGVVTNNVDPEQRGRLIVQVPDVLATTPSAWALPCLPVAGHQMGVFTVPPIGAHVWVEFEQGKPDYPIWVGGFWNSTGDVPAAALQGPAGDTGILLQTALGHHVLISDQPGPDGGIVLKSASGVSVIVNDTGIYLRNAQGASITLAQSTVSINNDALTVM